MQRWGAFSVIDHKNDVNVATELLLYDKIAVPTPDGEDRERWESNGWEPDKLNRLIKRLKEYDLVEEASWNAERQANWRRAFEQAKADIDRVSAELQLGIDRRVATATKAAAGLSKKERDKAVKAAASAGTRNEVISHLKGSIKMYHGPVEFYAAYQSRSDFEHHHPTEDAVKRGVERVNFLVQHRLVIPDVAPQKLLDRAIKIATNKTFKNRRHRFYEWQLDLLTGRHEPERVLVDLDRLVQEFNAQALAVAGEGRTETIITVLAVGTAASAATVAFGPAAGILVPPLIKGAAALSPFASAGAAILRKLRGARAADAAQRVAAPGAMFHLTGGDTGFRYVPIPRRPRAAKKR